MKISICIACLLLTAISSIAQQKDSLQTMQQFIKICSGYKQEPLYLRLNCITTTNLVTNTDDTGTVQAEFYITPTGSYTRFGEVEQLVNDSMALLVSAKLKRMMLYKNAATIIKQMKAITGVPVPGSSIKNLCDKYKISAKHHPREIQNITLQSRKPVYSTSLPAETIELQYNNSTKSIVHIVTTQRSLIALSQEEYNNFINKKEFTNNLVDINENYYVVKEKIMQYDYEKISHEPGIKIPVSFGERIVKNAEQKHVPAKAYEDYILTEE